MKPTAALAGDVPGAAPSAPRSLKVCHRCGIDLTGQRRYRDAQGHWCIRCHRADRNVSRSMRVPCDECNEAYRSDQVQRVQDLMLCPVCRQKRAVAALRQQAEVEQIAAEFEQTRRRRKRNRTLVVLGLEGALFLLAGAYLLKPVEPEPESRESLPGPTTRAVEMPP